MISSNLGSGYALVPVGPDDNPNHGGGPIRKSSGIALPAHAGTFVQRSPLNVVREAEAGSTWPVDLAAEMMFLPDGRLVPQKPYARPFGDSTMQPVFVQPFRQGVKPAFISMLLGAGAGGAMVSKHRLGGAIGGALGGGVLGLIFG